MDGNITEREQRLRIIRFFLPRLSRDDLAHEIEQEKEKLCETADQQISDIFQDGLGKITKRKSALIKKGLAWGLGPPAFLFIVLGLWGGTRLLKDFVVSGQVLVPLVWSVGVVMVCWIICAIFASKTRRRLEEQTAEIRKVRDGKLRALDADIEFLVGAYEGTLATEDEVLAFIHARLKELQAQVEPALGLEKSDIQDERSAEVWAPTAFQSNEPPLPVARDLQRSAREILQLGDEIIRPLQTALRDDERWQKFRERVLPLLGLARETDANLGNPEPTALSAMTAVRFSEKLQTFLVGHFFYQKIMCAQDFLGLFRAYVNVLNCRIAYTLAVWIPYGEVTTVGVETAVSAATSKQATCGHFKIGRLTEP